MPNYLQLGNCLQFSTLFGHIWDNWGNYQGNLWHLKENYRQYLDNFEPNCVTIGAIVTGFNAFIYTGLNGFVYVQA